MKRKQKILFLSGLLLLSSLIIQFQTNAETYPSELADAYDWAYSKGLTTMSNIDNANVYGDMTNGELAKMMVIYAENVLNLTPDTSKVCNFTDIDTVKGDLPNYIIESCQLGLMGQGAIEFKPYDIVNRATFGSALSRALRGDEYEGGTPYYAKHLEALKAAGIMNQIDNPENIKEIRGYLRGTLMRSEEIKSNELEFEEIDCHDLMTSGVCTDYPDICPEKCKPYGILLNKLTETVEFKSNENSRKVVFNGTIKALKDNTLINQYSIDTMAMYEENLDGSYLEERCQKNKTNMTFYIYIDGALIGKRYYKDACQLGQGAGFGAAFDDINMNKGQSKTVKVEVETEGYVQEDDIYKFTLYFTDTNKNIPLYGEKSISANLAPIKIVKSVESNNQFSIQTPSNQDTVYLKAKNSTLAEFTLKPSNGNSAYLNELSLEIDDSRLKGDDIILKIDDVEYDFTSTNDSYNLNITYQPSIKISSQGAQVKVILKQELEYDDYIIGTTVKSINGKAIGKVFSKRFVSALVYIKKQENKGSYTEFTLGVDKYYSNYSISSICMLTGTNGGGTCLLRNNYANGPFENGYTFTVDNSTSVQPINHITYFMKNSEKIGWGDSINIKREDYPDYFKTKSGDSRKIYAYDSSYNSEDFTEFVFGTISIANPNNPSKGITIMDRNLGATSNNITSSDSYGYYYQWGNNYGFNPDSRIKTSSTKVTWNESYNHHGYYDNIFRTIDRDYWADGIHNGLWGGENDSRNNNRGANKTNYNDRQGPCPNGYHVPSAGEWGQLVKYRKETYDKDVILEGNKGQYNFKDKAATRNFLNYFKLPLAGSFYDGLLESQEQDGGYWSSSTNYQNEGYAQHLSIRYKNLVRDASLGEEYELSQVYATAASPRTEGLPIRCFKNTYIPVQRQTNTLNEETTTGSKQTITGDKGETEKIKTENKAQNKTVKNDSTSSNTKQNGFTREMNNAYQFAYTNGITTTKNIETAKMNSPLTRIQMAKMLSNYAINVLGKEPDLSKGTVKFNDVTDKQNSQYDNAVTLAYQLGIMGQNIKNNNFRPNDIVTRAEFVTALSRMLYGTEDGKGSTKYYETHINKLYNEGIITKKDPKIHEKRGYVMIMLMRTAE